MAEAAQTIESGILDHYNILPSDHRIITSYVRSENDTETHNHLYTAHQEIEPTAHTNETQTYDPHASQNTEDCFVHHENLTDSVNGTTQIIFRRSRDSHLFEQIPSYVLQAEDNDHHHHGNILSSHEMQEVFQQYPNSNENCETDPNNGMLVVPNDDRISLIFNNPLQYETNQHHNLLAVDHHNDPNYAVVEQTNAPPQTVNVVLPLHDKDQLELTISPLLAAINDITSREGGHWNYNLNGIETTTNAVAHDNNTIHSNRYKMECLNDEYVDINDVNRIEMDDDRKPEYSDDDEQQYDDDGYDGHGDLFDNAAADDENENWSRNRPKRMTKKDKGRKIWCFPVKCECIFDLQLFILVTVVDKHVPIRAWASLPSTYLTIGKCERYTINSKPGK